MNRYADMPLSCSVLSAFKLQSTDSALILISILQKVCIPHCLFPIKRLKVTFGGFSKKLGLGFTMPALFSGILARRSRHCSRGNPWPENFMHRSFIKLTDKRQARPNADAYFALNPCSRKETSRIGCTN